MKIPKKDGTTDPTCGGVENWEDILCDKCGKTCRDAQGMNFEYATVTAHWGYASKKDLEQHEAHVCEACYDALGLKPEITYYM